MPTLIGCQVFGCQVIGLIRVELNSFLMYLLLITSQVTSEVITLEESLFSGTMKFSRSVELEGGVI